MITNLSYLRKTIQKLSVHNSLNSLEELLDFEIDNRESWPNLIELDCSHNNIPKIDESIV